ncbi:MULTISPECIES: hypothetical protein [Deinococcus]|uniref:hypothetical protein n=1 Tax=Deinococcus TaxID=1298 RepID=UPI0006DCA594|nr:MULTISPECIES: hypothetical protein [Deinococcus]
MSAPTPLPVQPVKQAQPVQAAPITYAPPRYVPPAPEAITPLPVTAQPVVVLPAPRPQSTGSAVAVTVLTPAPSETATAPVAPVTPTPAPVTYLGSVQSEGGQPIALLTVNGRDETVAAGQVIPGTSVKVVTVTPTQLTLRDAGGTRTVLLQEAE